MTRIERFGLAAGLALAVALMIPLRGYLTDDTFIHLQYARHLAAGNGPVFNVGDRVYGCTSPLWMALIAIGIRLGLDGLLVAKAIGGIATLASVALFFQLARQTLRAPALRAAAVVTWGAHAWMARWSLSGMETPLAVALVLAGLVAFTSSAPWGARPARSGAAWALATLARPEAALLLVLWAIVVLADRNMMPRARRLVAALLPAALIEGSWLLFARAYYGTFLPQTLSAKAAGGAGLEAEIENARRGVLIVGSTDGVLVALLVAALVLGARGRSARNSAARLLPWAWVIGVPALYLARGVPVLSRYLLPVLPVLAWLAWRQAETWWDAGRDTVRTAARVAGLGGLVAALAVGQNVVTWAVAVQPQVTSFTRGMERSLIPLGRWLGAHAAPGALIATPDIGAIGYFSQRPVLDLGGLVTPRMLPLLERATFEDVLARFAFADFAHPAFVLDRAAGAGDLLRRSPCAAGLALVDTASVPNLGIARPGRVVYTLYRVDWTRVDALLGSP